MIDAREVRLGNLVMYEQTTHIVAGIPEPGLIFSVWFRAPEERPYLAPEEQYSPIVLNDKQLKELGFEFCYGDIKTDAKFQNGEVEISGNFTDGFRLMNGEEMSAWSRIYKYVHEIQNLYQSLTGTELEIKTVAQNLKN